VYLLQKCKWSVEVTTKSIVRLVVLVSGYARHQKVENLKGSAANNKYLKPPGKVY
jgi:hypothetical protein